MNVPEAALIVVKELTKHYGGRVAVDGLDFEVARGEIVGFLGPNGAGKTTTLRMLTGFLAPTGGSVRIDGFDVATEPQRARARFGYLPEGVPMHAELRTSEYLAFRAELKGVRMRAASAEVDRCLELAGVVEARDRIIGQLSKGTRQRVGIADALLGDPPLLVLDEPTSGLDPNQMRHVRDLIRSFAGKKTVFLSTHILPEVEASCERVLIVRKGRKVAEGRPDELRARAAGDARLVVVTRDETGDLESRLRMLPGVRQVARDGADGRKLSLFVDPGDAVVDAVYDALRESNVALRELRRESSSLEDLFAELTTDEPEATEAA